MGQKMAAWWAYGSVILAAFLLIIAFAVVQWVARRAFSLAWQWCDDQLLSVVEIKKMSRQAKRQMSFNGMRASILDKGITQRLFEVRVYDHHMHRERTGILKVTSAFARSPVNACRPQWHDEGIDMVIKRPVNSKSFRKESDLEVA
jgi:hypothetical protein